ncbi:MAG: sensor histidine kinase [Hormoscilla sp.]
MFQTTRRRLALWYTAVTAVLLLLFATGVYLYVRSTLIERIDDTLNHVVEVVERSLVFDTEHPEWGLNLEASFGDRSAVVEDDHIDLEWFGPTGNLLWSTLSEPLEIPLHPNRTGATVQVGNAESQLLLRQVTEAVLLGDRVLGYLRVSHPWFEVTKPSRQLIVDLSLGISLMVASTAVIGWLLSGLAMEPVRAAYLSLKQFTADASHELRNPIAMIQTNVQASLAEPATEQHQPYRQQLQAIEKLTRRMGHLVDDLLFLARGDRGMVQHEWQLVPLDALLMEVHAEQQLPARAKDITLNLKLPEDPVEPAAVAFNIQGDWHQLTRLWANLLDNALEYTLAGGEIWIELQKLLSAGNNGYLQVQVRDNGIGIPKEALPHLFDRFYRVDPARSHAPGGVPRGSGLGLAIARAIVENHKGKIQIDSQLHRGTIVTVTLPEAAVTDDW